MILAFVSGLTFITKPDVHTVSYDRQCRNLSFLDSPEINVAFEMVVGKDIDEVERLIRDVVAEYFSPCFFGPQLKDFKISYRYSEIKNGKALFPCSCRTLGVL